MRLTLLFALSFLYILGVPSPRLASAEVPIPERKQTQLAASEKEIKEKKEKFKSLKNTLDQIDDEITGLKSDMVKAARDVKKRERSMTTLEDKINGLQKKRTSLQKKLQKDHKDLSKLATALLRLRQIPPEALLARPGAPMETAQAAMVLSSVAAPLQSHAQELRVDLQELDSLEKSLLSEQESLRSESQKMLADQSKLQDLIRRREVAYTKIKKDAQDQEEDLRRLAQEAQDFKDLVKKLEEHNRRLAIQNAEKSIDSGVQVAHASIPSARDRERVLSAKGLGEKQLPVSGRIRIGYGTVDDRGAQSEGIKIEGRAGGVVVAPMNGVIRYKGFFKNYGNMVIIEHAKNYHSLVAGLAKIDTVVGQSVTAGEPMGSMGAGRNARPSLYYELRYNGKPINPARLFPDAG